MGLSGGGDRSELRPNRPDGNIDHDLGPDTHVVGNHKGQFAGFNWVNPPPGCVIQWGTRRDLLGARQRGWRPATQPGDGHPAYEIAEHYASDLGTETPFPEYVPLITTEENFRRLMDEQMEANKAQLGPAGLGYLDKVPADEYDTGRQGRSALTTRFATRDHGTFVVEGDRTVEHLTPQGILREEDI